MDSALGTVRPLCRAQPGDIILVHSAAEGILFNILPVDYKNQLNAAIKTVGGTPLFEFKKNLVFP